MSQLELLLIRKRLRQGLSHAKKVAETSKRHDVKIAARGRAEAYRTVLKLIGGSR